MGSSIPRSSASHLFCCRLRARGEPGARHERAFCCGLRFPVQRHSVRQLAREIEAYSLGAFGREAVVRMKELANWPTPAAFICGCSQFHRREQVLLRVLVTTLRSGPASLSVLERNLTSGTAANWNVFEVLSVTNFRGPGETASLRAVRQRDRRLPLHLHSS